MNPSVTSVIEQLNISVADLNRAKACVTQQGVAEVTAEELCDWTDAIGGALALLDLLRWRDVEDELPQIHTDILLYTPNERICIGQMLSLLGSWWDTDWLPEESKPTHWRPIALPESGDD